jgi:hypothetical protein
MTEGESEREREKKRKKKIIECETDINEYSLMHIFGKRMISPGLEPETFSVLD